MAVISKWWFVVCSFIQLYYIALIALVRQISGSHRYAKDSELPRQDGKIAIVTGGGRGIGKHVAKRLALLGAHVIIASRAKEEAEAVIQEIQGEVPTAKVEHMFLDLSSLDSVRKFATDFIKRGLPLHLLINNAGVMLIPFKQTTDKFEEHMAVNFLAPVTLTCLLLPKLEKSGRSGSCSRIVNTSSIVHYVGDIKTVDWQGTEFSTADLYGSGHYSSHAAYPKSKLALILFTNWLQRHLESTNANVTANALHPGVVNTELYENVHWILTPMRLAMKPLMKTVNQGACTTVFTAVAPSLEGLGGLYLDNCQPTKSSQVSYDRQLQDSLCDKVSDILGLDWR